MELLYNEILTYIAIYLLLLVGYYLIPVSIVYYIFFVKQREGWNHMRIQKSYPSRSSITREIKWSLISLLQFALYTLILYHFILAGDTKMYYSVEEYGWGYFIFSIIAALFIHDTFYYFAHRLMHNRHLFRYVHRVHHQSFNPTPWAIYSFQPAETFIQFAIYPLLLFSMPFHPFALGIFLGYDLFINTVGHCGFEFLPRWFIRNWFYRWQNPVTHHDMHHSKVNCNFGLYFNIWDRIMGTLDEKYEEQFDAIKSRIKSDMER